MNKQQITNLFGTGTMVALMIAIGLLLGDRSQPSSATEIAAPIVQTSSDSALDTLQIENSTLQQQVLAYQEREVEYAAQIELANQLLTEQSVPVYDGEAEHDDDEEYEYEKEDDDE